MPTKHTLAADGGAVIDSDFPYHQSRQYSRADLVVRRHKVDVDWTAVVI